MLSCYSAALLLVGLCLLLNVANADVSCDQNKEDGFLYCYRSLGDKIGRTCLYTHTDTYKNDGNARACVPKGNSLSSCQYYRIDPKDTQELAQFEAWCNKGPWTAGCRNNDPGYSEANNCDTYNLWQLQQMIHPHPSFFWFLFPFCEPIVTFWI